MGNYDGSIKMNTKIETKDLNSQMLSVANAIKKSEDEIVRLNARMDELKNKKIPTAEYIKLQKQLEDTQRKFNQVADTVATFQKIGTDKSVIPFRKARDGAQELYMKVEEIRGAMFDLEESGKAFTSGMDTKEYTQAVSKVQQLTGNIEVGKRKLAEMQDKQEPVTEGFSRMRKVTGGIATALNTASNIGKRAFHTLGNVAKKAFVSISSGARQGNGLLSTFASRLKGLTLSLFIFNWISKGFNAMISGMKTGFTNFAAYSSDFANGVQGMKNALSTLGNQLAAAFAPIAQIVIPYLSQLIGYVTSAVNALAQFIAILGGKSTWTRATKVQKGYASSLDGTAASAKKAAGALASFDEIEVLNKKDNSSAGGGINPGSMFEEVPVGKLSDFWKKLLDALKKGKWYELGKFLGEQLKKALDNIPWNEIKEKARNVGKNLADLINGFIEVEGLGYSIGRTLAEAFNTGFEFLNSFVHEFHFDSLGRFLAETFNGLFENIDWPLIKDTFVTGAKGLADLINNFDQYFHWDNISDTISNGLNTLAETIITFFETADWLDIGKNVGEQLIKSIEKTDWESVGRAIGDVLHSAIVFLAGVLSEWNWGVIADALKDLVTGVFSAFDDSELPDNIKVIADAIEKFGIAIAALVTVKGISDLATTLGSFFNLFTGTTIATDIGGTSTELAGLATTLGELFAIIAGGEFVWKTFITEMDELSKAENRNSQQVDALKERYGGELFTSVFHMATDAVGGFSAALDGLPFALEGVTGKMDALDKMMRSIGDGTIYTDEQLKKAQDTWKLSADDVEMLRQAMFDANDTTFAWSNAFPELDNASAQTLANITEGMALMRDGTITNEVELANLAEQSGYTNEAFSFLADCMTESTQSMVDGLLNVTESTQENTVALQEEQTELTNTNTSLDTHQRALENTNTKLKNTQTEMTNTKNKSKEMADGIKTDSGNVKKTTDEVWPQVGSKMKTEMRMAHDSICEMLASITAEINNVLAAIGALTKAGASAGASIGSSVLASVQSVQPQSVVQDIPHLASGSVIRGGDPFIALLGDQPRGQTNVEAPLSTIKQAMREELSGMNYNSGMSPTVVLNINGQEFARLTLDDILNEAGRQGYDVSVLGVG
ncbi:MAG: hypothetical protein DBY33_04110 [Lachnospiraceae bacterium]|nr:MAG: hypothetical protein DBY33_04110 [Lachnospiraceae bacterium]